MIWDSGYLLTPAVPGLGLELNDAVIAANPVTDSAALHLEMCLSALSSDNRLKIFEL